jgi:hypothetical protein
MSLPSPNNWYKVDLIVNNSSCNYPSITTKYFWVYDGVGCTVYQPELPISAVQLIVNPTSTYSILEYELHEQGLLSIILFNPQTGQIETEYVWQSGREPGFYEEELATEALNPGLYQLHVLFNGVLQYRNLVKL